MNAAPISPQNRTFPTEIAEALRARILRGDFVPGDRLPPERELALSLGTNRNTLREALRSLEAQGLIMARQGDGIHVLDFRERGELGLLAHYFPLAPHQDQVGIMVDLLRLRSLVAKEVVTRAAEHGNANALHALPGLLASLTQTHAQGDVPATIRNELALYRGMVRASQSVMGLWLFNSLERVLVGFLDASPGLWVTPNNYLETWQAVVDAVVARQAKAAAQALSHMYAAIDEGVVRLLQTHTLSSPNAEVYP